MQAEKEVPKGDLLYVAHRIIDRKLHLTGQLGGNGVVKALLMSAEYGTAMDSNDVSISARVRVMGEVSSVANVVLAPLIDSMHGAPILVDGSAYDTQAPRAFPVGEHTLAFLFQLPFQEPCFPAGKSLAEMHQLSGDPGQSVFDNQDGVMQPSGDNPFPTGGNIQQSENYYELYKMTSLYKGHEGYFGVPYASAAPGQASTAILRMSAGRLNRHITYESIRVNAWPKIPSLDPFEDVNGIFHAPMDYNINPNAAEVSADGLNRYYSVGGFVNYVMSRRPTAEESLPVGKLPYITDDSGVLTTMPGSVWDVNFTELRVDGSGGAGAGPDEGGGETGPGGPV